MRVGEILLQHRWVDWESLALAIDDHRGARMRLCSYLVWKGVVDFDNASRALGEQLGVAAVLRKHLEHRDRSLTPIIPVALARRRVVLPIGRLGNGALIVCARDPSPALRAQLARVVPGEIMLAVAPAKYVERLVATSYPRGASAEIDVPIEVDDADELSDHDLLAEDDETGNDFDIDVEVPAEPVKPVSTSKPLPVQIKPIAAKATGAAPARDSLDTTIAGLADIDDVQWLLDVVMGYVQSRWTASLLLEIRERRAVGLRGHGHKLKPAAIKAFALPLAEPSVVQLARDEQRVIDTTPDDPGRGHENLVAVLEATSPPVAAPIVKADAVTHVLVVGDPVTGDPEDSPIDLGLLCEAMQDALARL